MFGGVTTHPLSTEGIWMDPKTRKKYYDNCRRFEVSMEKSDENENILKNLKEEFKKMFKQEEIFMYYSEITQI